MATVTMAFTCFLANLEICILWQEGPNFSLDNLYLAGKVPLLVGDMSDDFLDILPKTKKGSACCGMAGSCHLTWMSSDSLYLP